MTNGAAHLSRASWSLFQFHQAARCLIKSGFLLAEGEARLLAAG